MKLKHALDVYKITSTGFPAVQGIGIHSNKDGMPVALSTLPASVLYEQGITKYLAPRFERGQVFETTEEIIEANIEVDAFEIIGEFTPNELRKIMSHDNTVIVSRHIGTIEILKKMYPDAVVYDGNVSKDDIEGKHVVGTLPPYLLTHVGAYSPATIKDFDYTVDGDLKGEELDDRLTIGKPFRLRIVVGDTLPETLDEILTDFNVSGYTVSYKEYYFPFDAYKLLDFDRALGSCEEVVLYKRVNDVTLSFGTTAILCENNRLHVALHGYV